MKKNSNRSLLLIGVAALILAMTLFSQGCSSGSGDADTSVISPTPTTTVSPSPTATVTPTPSYESNGTWEVTKNAEDPTVSAYAGTYDGTFFGDDVGSIRLVICSDGSVFIYGDSGDIRIFGRGLIATDGTFSGDTFEVSDSTATTGTFDGTISGSDASGNWTLDSSSGTWVAGKLSESSELAPYAGGYQGSLAGDDTGAIHVGIGPEGTIIGTTFTASSGDSGIMGAIAADGTASGSFEGNNSLGILNGTISSSTGDGSGTWGANAK